MFGEARRLVPVFSLPTLRKAKPAPKQVAMGCPSIA